MIQRIQSIWLFLAGATISCLLFLPMVTSNLIGGEFYIIASGLYQKVGGATKQVASYLPLLISTVAVMLICLANIFNFKNRKRQKQLAYVSIVLIIGLSFWCSQYAKQIPGGLETANYDAGMFLPPLAIAFCLLAVRGINRDEALLKSADRLR
jgi:glucan phosphoethanolaminetransferase (alkaline phosphatase superfamily)